ncbi:phospholipase D active site motif protein [Athelia psychrophila]|uniref:Phospholipase D active site motif protein n=1 Tax=Athelia psychrophila TaxID=1759441 RepID=A0A165XCX0_9AGAM|nr:phospholipase D active site motif protein [Fibularhizoctonia sp. CBS 109695]
MSPTPFIPDKLFELFQSKDTVTTHAAANPKASIDGLAEKLYKGHKSNGKKLVVGIFAESLRTFEHDPLTNLVSPPLTAATGVIPLSIISVIPDIIRHYADCIVAAETEVFLATTSTAAKIITDAIRELNRRAGERGTRIVMKVMYDRGNIKQVLKAHQIVPPAVYTADEVKLPAPQEIPNIDLEVCNYHHVVLGTFHAKYMVVDRKVALINSNNIQDRVNVEMMTHVEGPIVESFYDMCLLSWGNALTPPLPLLAAPPPAPAPGSYRFQDDHAHIASKDLDSHKVDAAKTLQTQEYPGDLGESVKGGQQDGYDVDHATEKRNGEGGMHADTGAGGEGAGEVRADKLLAITKHLNTNLQPDTKATLPDGVDMEDFSPHIVHAPHAPFPIAMVNRKPKGSINYTDTDNPQDTAWLAAMKYAKSKVFIQTPTFNAVPMVEATLAAVRRGVEVTLFIDLGFNDGGEQLPLQGGTNEVVMAKMFKELEAEHKPKFRAFWYTAKDMCRPINASKKQRNCHVKVMIVDDAVGIQGNGNQDAQSWFHSQEANILIDSPAVCKEWADGIRSNQNTHLYGRLAEDGIWRDPKDGSLLEDMGSTKGGGVSGLIKGLTGAVKRVQGTGGF